MSNRVEGWFRKLNNGRLEVFLKAQGLKVRCSGSQDQINAFADFFESETGLLINSPDSSVFTRVRRGSQPIQGQLNLIEAGEPEIADAEDAPGASSTEWTPGLGGDEFTADMEARR